MLKFEGFKVGDVIKAMEFQPMEGRPDRFHIGTVSKVVTKNCNYAHYILVSDNQEVKVPMETTFDFESRVTKVEMETNLEQIEKAKIKFAKSDMRFIREKGKMCISGMQCGVIEFSYFEGEYSATTVNKKTGQVVKLLEGKAKDAKKFLMNNYIVELGG